MLSSAKATIGNKLGSFMIILGNEISPPERNEIFRGGARAQELNSARAGCGMGTGEGK